MVKTLIDNIHKRLKGLEEEIVDNEEILNIADEIKNFIKEDRYIIDCIEDLKKDYPDKIAILEEASHNDLVENDPKFLKTEFSGNKWKYLTKKLAYPYEYFKSTDNYPKPVDNLKTEDFFSKSKNGYPSDEE